MTLNDPEIEQEIRAMWRNFIENSPCPHTALYFIREEHKVSVYQCYHCGDSVAVARIE